MFQYRVTKYNPTFRDVSGVYTRNEWTAFCDIGKSFNEVILTNAEYQRVESAYVSTVVAFLQESNVLSLVVCGLENYGGIVLGFSDGSSLSLKQIEVTLPRILREEFWCKLKASQSFVHVGYDYYMYLGVPVVCPKAEQLAASLGLFVELFQSPYNDVEV